MNSQNWGRIPYEQSELGKDAQWRLSGRWGNTSPSTSDDVIRAGKGLTLQHARVGHYSLNVVHVKLFMLLELPG